MENIKNTVEDATLAQLLRVEFLVDLIPGSNMVLEFGRGVGSWFWHPSFWLPKGFTWEDIAPTTENLYPQFYDVITYPFFVGAFIYFLRFYILNPFVYAPLARKTGLKYRIRNPPPRNQTLEKLFLANKSRIKEINVCSAAAGVKWPKRQVERWFRQRLVSSKLNKLDKFQESAFIATYHVVISLYGLLVMYDKPWLRDISHTWINYPLHEIERGDWWYYIISISFYWALCFSHLRCGPAEYLHHTCTILLLTFSWAVNLIRAGSLVLLIHECGDIFLQISKMFQYLNKKRATEVLTAVFVVIWVSTRMGLFPFWVLRNMYFEAPKHVFMPAGYVFYVLLFGLLLLNLFWTGIILVVVYKSVFKGSDVNDIRSSDSASTHGSDDNIKQE